MFKLLVSAWVTSKHSAQNATVADPTFARSAVYSTELRPDPYGVAWLNTPVTQLGTHKTGAD